MSTSFAAHVISMSDAEVAKVPHIDTVRLLEASTVSSKGVISNVNIYEFWTHADTSAALVPHPSAVWNRLSMRLSSGPGLFGRAVTLHFGWGHENMTVPTTIKAFSTLSGYQSHVFGGVFGLSDDQTNVPAPFNSGRSDVAKANSFVIGGRIVLYYFFEEATLGQTQGPGPRVVFRFDGEFSVYGRN